MKTLLNPTTPEGAAIVKITGFYADQNVELARATITDKNEFDRTAFITLIANSVIAAIVALRQYRLEAKTDVAFPKAAGNIAVAKLLAAKAGVPADDEILCSMTEQIHTISKIAKSLPAADRAAIERYILLSGA